MRTLIGADIVAFHASHADFLALTADGDYIHLDRSDIAGDGHDQYAHTITHTGTRVQILMDRATFHEREWLQDATREDGTLDPDVAEDAADFITDDGILPGHLLAAGNAERAWQEAANKADRLAAERARIVADIVTLAGSQSEAARRLMLNQSTVSRLVKKHEAAKAAEEQRRAAIAAADAITEGSRVHVSAYSVPEDWARTGEIIEVGEETVVVELDGGRRQELPKDEVTPA
ncbi:hypothetical protein [Streptomyces sp. NPDC005953]|uniref:hypothetical protein n=1 Tax=Streptomyces sp. NPDC005953 TaxID=3156719 RepID=UPI0033DB3FC7